MEILLPLLGLAYFVFALTNLRFAVLLLPLFFPAYLLKFDVGGVPFPLVEVFIYATTLACVLRTVYDLVKKKLSWKELFAPYKSSLLWAVAGIVVAAVVSTVITPQSVVMMDGNTVFYGRKVALGILKSWIIAPLLMLGLFAWIMKTSEDMEFALNSYTVSAVVLAGWGIYQVLTGRYITPDGRASGPFNSANYLALFIAPALFYALVRAKDCIVTHENSWFQRILHIFRRPQEQRERFMYALAWSGGFLLLLFGLLFTKSYAAFLAVFVVCLMWGAVQVKNWKKFPWKVLLILVGIVVLLGIGLIALDPVKWQKFFELTTRTSSGVRVEIYTIASGLLLQHPFLGIGLGMFPAAYQLQGPVILGHNPYEWNMLHPHNEFLAFWLNLGLIGFASFLWVIKVCFQKAWNSFRNFRHLQQNGLQWFQAVGFLMFLIVLFHGLVDTPFFKNDLALMFWLIVSVIVLPVSRKKDS